MTQTPEQMKKDALAGLCYSDPQSAYYSEPYDEEPRTFPCGGCDSCFYGRDTLARHIITLLEERQ